LETENADMWIMSDLHVEHMQLLAAGIVFFFSFSLFSYPPFFIRFVTGHRLPATTSTESFQH
jgi:hypothetical protein